MESRYDCAADSRSIRRSAHRDFGKRGSLLWRSGAISDLAPEQSVCHLGASEHICSQHRRAKLGYDSYTNPYSSALRGSAWDPMPAGQRRGSAPALPPYGTTPTQPSLGFLPRLTAPQTRLIQSLECVTRDPSRRRQRRFGIEDLDLFTSLAFPFFFNHNIAPILFTPGFNFHFLQARSPPPRDLPPTVYDAFGQLSWKPQFYDRLGADLAISLGVYSDFQYADHTSLRILGRALGTWTVNPQWQLR